MTVTNLATRFEQLTQQQTIDEDLVTKIQDEINLIEQEVQRINDPVTSAEWANYKKNTANNLKTRGNTLLTAGDNVQAEAWFTVCIFLEPTNYVFYSNRSAARTNLGKYVEAIADADQTIQLNPQWARGYGRKAAACFLIKRYDESLQAYKSGLAIEPQNETFLSGKVQVETKVEAQNHNERGEELFAKNKMSEALNSFTQAIEKDPTEHAFWGNRYDVYMSQGRYEEALGDADQITRLRPDWVKAYQRRGDALSRLERHDEAGAAYSAALRLDPGNAQLAKDVQNAVQDGVRYRMRKNMEAAAAKQK